MRITNKQLKQIIKEELSKLLNERNDLIDYNGYENYLQSPRYIKGGKCKADFASTALNNWLKKTF